MTNVSAGVTGAAVPAHSAAQVQRAVAGAGKTHWLVERYVALVVDAQPATDPANVVVITFTEAAARELIDRVRSRLVDVADEPGDATRAAQARQALAGLTAAPIGTIHAFARRVLMQHAAVVGLPYGVDVVDEVDPSTRQMMARRVRARIIERADEHGVALRSLVRATGQRPSALADDAVALLGDVSAALLRHPDWAAPDPAVIAAAESRAWREARNAFGLQPGILLAGSAGDHLRTYLAAADSVTTTAGEFEKRREAVAAMLAAVTAMPADAEVVGALKPGRSSWLTKPMRAACAKAGLDDALAAADALTAHTGAVKQRDERRSQAMVRLAGIHAVEAFLWARSAGGTKWLLQDELLQRAFCLVRDNPQLRAALQESYPYVLLDEAQDIDATQRELLLALTDVGGLTVVGDPQQSIYGFRGADHRTFEQLQQELLGEHEHEPEHLRTTRRCLPVIVDAVNAIFASDDEHTTMAAHRTDVERGSVTVLNAQEVSVVDPDQPDADQKPTAMDYRAVQADAIADAVVDFLSDGAPEVWDRASGQWRAPRASDIAVLVASRTPVGDIVEALRRRGVVGLARTSRDLARDPVAEGLAAALLAISEPADTRALLLALRSPVFALTDEQITRHCLSHGRLRLWQQGDADSAVAQALATLREAATVMRRRGPGRAATHLVDRQALLAVLTSDTEHGWQSGWVQVRLLVDTATDYWLNHGGSASQFAGWLREQLAAAATTNRSVLSEPDADYVTITTIHQAKGLQWPIVVVAAETGDEPAAPRLSFGPDDIYTRLGARAAYLPEDDEPTDGPPERARRQYVALTRAGDHLVISTIARPRREVPDSLQPAVIVARLTEALGVRLGVRTYRVAPGHHVAEERPATAATSGRHRPAPDASTPAGRPAVTAEAITEHLAAVAASAARMITMESPSDAGHGYAAQSSPVEHVVTAAVRSADLPVDDDAAPTLSPQVARDFGTRVHELLEVVDLATFTDPSVPFNDALATAALPVDVGTIDPRTRQVLAAARHADVLRRAAAAAVCRREIPIGGHRFDGDVEVVTDGVIDLLFAEPQGDELRWVLVDYKTDTTDRSVADFAALYAAQLATYERLLADCGIVASEKILLRLAPTGVTEVRVA